MEKGARVERKGKGKKAIGQRRADRERSRKGEEGDRIGGEGCLEN